MRPNTVRTTLRLAAALVIFGTAQAHAMWQTNGLALTPGTSIKGTGMGSDSTGGMIVTWIVPTDPNTFLKNAYALRVLGTGTMAPDWSPTGNLIASHNFFEGNLSSVVAVVPDGLGGALIPYMVGYHGPNFFATRVTASGTRPTGWPAGLCGNCMLGPVVDGGSGSALTAWRSWSTDVAVRLTRLLSDGTRITGSIGDVTNQGRIPSISSDEAGGAIVMRECMAWRVNPSFTLLWEQPLSYCDPTGNLASISDGAGGAFLGWWSGSDVRVIRVGPDGVPDEWDSEGVVAGPHAPPTTSIPQLALALDGSGGVFVGWAGGGSRGFLQRISGSGQIVAGWPAVGRVLGRAAGVGTLSAPVADGAGGAYVGWDESRGIYAQHLTAAGSVASGWIEGGGPVCSITSEPVYAATDRAGGVLFAWHDHRDGSYRVYGQHFSAGEGPPLPVDVAPAVPAALQIEGTMPNPARNHVECSFRLPRPGTAELELFDTSGRRVAQRVLVGLRAGHHLANLEHLDGQKAGVYYLRLTQAGAMASTKVVLTR